VQGGLPRFVRRLALPAPGPCDIKSLAMTAPVNFNFGAAQNVISEIDRTRSVLTQQMQDRWTQGLSIRQSWRGPYAVRFDGDRTNSDSEAQSVLCSLGALRAKVQNAIDLAQAYQRRGQ
jgi:hypothetical protein